MTSVQHPTATWEAMDGGVFYRKQEVYTMQWKVKTLSDYIVSGAKYGGPIAMMRDPHKIVAFGTNQFSKPTVQVFSSSGELLQTIPWDQGTIVSMGWTYEEQLVIINDEGMYRLYTLQGDYQQFSLGPEAAEMGVIDAKIYEQGLVALTSNVTLFEVKGWTGSKPLTLAHPGFSEPPPCWSLIEPDQTLSLGDFFRLLEEGGPRFAQATNLLQVYAREQNRELLRDYYFQDDRRVDSACLALDDASRAQTNEERLEAVSKAAKFFAEDKDRGFEAKAMDEYAKLLALQKLLEDEAGGKISFVGLSVNDTIRRCITTGYLKRADRIRSDFKVPEKRFWYIKLYALTETKDFDGLEAFAKSKRSPIGYEPFINHLIKSGYLKQAASYVPRCDAKTRADLYVRCGEWRLAALECKERNDRAKLEELRRTCTNILGQRELEQYILSNTCMQLWRAMGLSPRKKVVKKGKTGSKQGPVGQRIDKEIAQDNRSTSSKLLALEWSHSRKLYRKVDTKLY
ncbi:hypothetical protein M407DRAFT_235273 [Tulasnella calospora MUT 4182]|uniref:Vacuolar protein sorting-associated protein 16 homolog n=1 Tax=Tulasnella calospora MUT 4182 TaxID=1051891 RepID=A0A0C3Q151_9AGAM|nr:hypothetical protein M407DRAFT_235273 [Tulasnella calospora MUT 4182]